MKVIANEDGCGVLVVAAEVFDQRDGSITMALRWRPPQNQRSAVGLSRST
jgi:hypothetical protein